MPPLWRLVWNLTILALLSSVLQVEAKHKHKKLKVALHNFDREFHIDEKLADVWFPETEEEMRSIRHSLALAEWNFVTNVTTQTEKEMVHMSMVASNYTKFIANEARELRLLLFITSESRRRLKLLGEFTDPPDINDQRALNQRQNQLTEIYATATLQNEEKTYRLEPELTDLMKTKRDPKVLEWAWRGWREATGKKMKNVYAELVDLLNKGAKENNFADYGKAWRDEQFESTPELMSMCAKLYSEIAPMYMKVHAYVRAKLQKYYKENYPEFEFPTDGTIPAHLLGNMWAQEFQGIYDIVKPFPEVPEPNVEKAMKDQEYDVTKLFKLAEEFYTSLGLDPMTDAFWKNSMIVRPKGREVQCHASASDFFTNETDPNKDDFRIKMCTEVNPYYFETIHHEMGHIQYFMEYRNQPVEFRDGANQAFHEAIGDTISLSVQTEEHLQKVRLLPDTKVVDRTYYEQKQINFLMKQALFKIAFLPYGYLIDLWRFGVFDGTIKKDHYNTEYWKLRLQYQGVSPPVMRTEQDFDPGAKFHIPTNSPYICYFISFIAQFQFYETLCKESGHVGPLHHCDFYNSKKAGAKLRSFLRLGKSKHWKEALQVFTGSREIKTDAIRTYFKPLMDWLDKEENKKINVGWKGVHH